MRYGRGNSRLLALCGSLRLAIALLTLFTICLIVATLLEARYGARVAQELVYRAWWFTLLLAILSVNVLAAALKKIPWKRHQIGFLVTHVGLLLMLAGGLLTAQFGEEGQVALIDTDNSTVHAHLGLSNRTEAMALTGEHQLEVYALKPAHSHTERQWFALLQRLETGGDVATELHDYLDGYWTHRFVPGCFAWHSDDYFALQLPWQLRALYFLASPWPAFSATLNGTTTLTIDNFYPHADEDANHRGRFVPRSQTTDSDAPQRPALRCRLSRTGAAQEFWIGLERGVVPVRLQDALYLVRYRPVTRPLGFALTLRRAKQIKDPGSERPAWFESEVTVASRSSGAVESTDHRIFMNHPLSQGPYHVYQSNYRAITNPATSAPLKVDGKPVSLSGLSVASDPGLWFKYAGTIVVVLGIATMFYMRAYFFRASHRNVNGAQVASLAS